MLTTDLVERVLSTVPNRTVGVLGDLFLDRYLDIDAARNEPSVETGLTAYQVTRVRAYPGAVGTVVNNLAALGVGRIVPIAFIGDDGEGYELQQALRQLPAVDQNHVFLLPDRRTPTYTKPMLHEAGTVRELNRLDIKNRVKTTADAEERIIALLNAAWPKLDALIVLDQVSEVDCGVVTKCVRDHIAELGGRDPDKFVLADSREQIELFANVSVKPNTDEIGKAFLRNAERGGEETFPSSPAIFQTAGADGIWLHLKGAIAPNLVKTYAVSGPIDICGAGDSTSAGITSAMVSGLTHEQAAAFGNLVASITIQQIGVTGTAPPDKVRARWREVSGG
ncbi:bifunctional heptose 7-phosphate kinase/heptose 1-phosphate adenyltransferase [Gemmata sp.]|uniref:bifunctional heptose 7-phosphate kinase/heptose 1-phosphate adenyltransferase n=1 Tax=Gemmata sp. TaxID=1914242 RepID=UPI003F72594E